MAKKNDIEAAADAPPESPRERRRRSLSGERDRIDFSTEHDGLAEFLHEVEGDPDPFSPHQTLFFDEAMRLTVRDSFPPPATPSFREEIDRILKHAGRWQARFEESLRARRSALAITELSNPTTDTPAVVEAARHVVHHLRCLREALARLEKLSCDTMEQRFEAIAACVATLIANSVALGAAASTCRHAKLVDQSRAIKRSSAKGGKKKARFKTADQMKMGQWVEDCARRNRMSVRDAAKRFVMDQDENLKTLGLDTAEPRLSPNTIHNYWRRFKTGAGQFYECLDEDLEFAECTAIDASNLLKDALALLSGVKQIPDARDG